MNQKRSTLNIHTCHCCGLAQQVPLVRANQEAGCVRCHTRIDHQRARLRSHSRTAAVALSALILYPAAVLLPIMRIEQMGIHHDASIFDGTATLLREGHIFVGIVVLLCSIVLPLAKLAGLLALSSGRVLMHMKQRAWAYRFVEFTGRWGMLDVLAVAVLVAVVKLGASVELSAGPGAAAFAAVVILSLIASTLFDPHALWADEPARGPQPLLEPMLPETTSPQSQEFQ
ncbi:MAG: paraquat-inducible protein A [Phycisphaerales bacterium]